jgi:hypothetical protein
MQVSVLYFADCPNWREAGLRLRLALDELGQPDTDITFIAVETDADAAAVGFQGSPTITVDGEDLFPSVSASAGGLSCRVYSTAGRLAGAPGVADLVAALRERTGR